MVRMHGYAWEEESILFTRRVSSFLAPGVSGYTSVFRLYRPIMARHQDRRISERGKCVRWIRRQSTRTAQSDIPRFRSFPSIRIMSENGRESGGITIGGIHFPDVTEIFRHHPARPAPPTGGPIQTPVPVGTMSGYFKYFAAGAICATVTHVCFPVAKY